MERRAKVSSSSRNPNKVEGGGSAHPVAPFYESDDLSDLDYQRDLNDPGEFPYTRGIHPTGYRGKLWTMRQFAGFGTPEETNNRYHQ